MYINLNNKGENSFFIFVNLKKLENIIIKKVEAMLNFTILRANNKIIL